MFFDGIQIEKMQKYFNIIMSDTFDIAKVVFFMFLVFDMYFKEITEKTVIMAKCQSCNDTHVVIPSCREISRTI